MPKSPVRIAIVLPPSSRFDVHRPTSIETVVRTLARHSGQDEQVRIFCEAGASDHGTDRPVEAFDRRDHLGLVRALQGFDPDLIEFHQNVRAGNRLTRHLPRAVTVAYRHNALKAPRHAFDRWRYQQRYSKIDRFILVSEAERALMEDTYPVLAGRGVAIPNAIDATDWFHEPGERDKRIIFSGRAIPEKGVAEVCAALPRVLDAEPGWKATLLLNDWDKHADWARPLLAPLARFAERIDIRHSVPLAEVQGLLKRSDIALTPSLWAEPLGLTALEAHAAGVALVSSGRGGLREASGPHALYVDPVTPEALADAMIALIRSPQRRIAMAQQAQAYVLAEHSPQRRATDLARARREMLALKALETTRRHGWLPVPARSSEPVRGFAAPDASYF